MVKIKTAFLLLFVWAVSGIESIYGDSSSEAYQLYLLLKDNIHWYRKYLPRESEEDRRQLYAMYADLTEHESDTYEFEELLRTYTPQMYEFDRKSFQAFQERMAEAEQTLIDFMPYAKNITGFSELYNQYYDLKSHSVQQFPNMSDACLDRIAQLYADEQIETLMFRRACDRLEKAGAYRQWYDQLYTKGLQGAEKGRQALEAKDWEQLRYQTLLINDAVNQIEGRESLSAGPSRYGLPNRDPFSVMQR